MAIFVPTFFPAKFVNLRGIALERVYDAIDDPGFDPKAPIGFSTFKGWPIIINEGPIHGGTHLLLHLSQMAHLADAYFLLHKFRVPEVMVTYTLVQKHSQAMVVLV